MQRILIVVVVLLVIWRILATIGKKLSERAPGADSFSRFSPEARRRRQQWSQTTPQVEDLVECAACGTFVPTGRALTSGDHRVYCSEHCQHRDRRQRERQQG